MAESSRSIALRQAFDRERQDAERQAFLREEADHKTDLLYQRLWYADHYPELAPKKRERSLAYHYANRDERLAKMRAYHQKNRDKLNAEARERRKLKKDRYNEARRAKRLQDKGVS